LAVDNHHLLIDSRIWQSTVTFGSRQSPFGNQQSPFINRQSQLAIDIFFTEAKTGQTHATVLQTLDQDYASQTTNSEPSLKQTTQALLPFEENLSFVHKHIQEVCS